MARETLVTLGEILIPASGSTSNRAKLKRASSPHIENTAPRSAGPSKSACPAIFRCLTFRSAGLVDETEVAISAPVHDRRSLGFAVVEEVEVVIDQFEFKYRIVGRHCGDVELL